MTHIISIDLVPAVGPKIDLGDAPCKWERNTKDQRDEGFLLFLDAPYGFYDYVYEAFGNPAGNDEVVSDKFFNEFFDMLHKEILSKGGLSDDMQLTLVMPKFFNLTFNINIFTDNE
jgi:hypothetical protein